VKQEMEDTLGADLAEVRIHRDVAAQSAARREQAEAFTAGRDIYFGEGSYDPTGSEGKRLLAHELAHVLQQTGHRTSDTMIVATARSGSGDIQRQPSKEPSFVAPPRRYAPQLASLHGAATEPADRGDAGDPGAGTDDRADRAGTGDRDDRDRAGAAEREA
jgi:uncharacterized protein DUF4157